MMEQITSDEEITIRDGKYTIAHFEDSGNGMQGDICEGSEPIPFGLDISAEHGGRIIRMTPSDLIAIAKWLLGKAEERQMNEETS